MSDGGGAPPQQPGGGSPGDGPPGEEPAQTTCPTCQRSIPSSNLVTHEVREREVADDIHPNEEVLDEASGLCEDCDPKVLISMLVRA